MSDSTAATEDAAAQPESARHTHAPATGQRARPSGVLATLLVGRSAWSRAHFASAAASFGVETFSSPTMHAATEATAVAIPPTVPAMDASSLTCEPLRRASQKTALVVMMLQRIVA